MTTMQIQPAGDAGRSNSQPPGKTFLRGVGRAIAELTCIFVAFALIVAAIAFVVSLCSPSKPQPLSTGALALENANRLAHELRRIDAEPKGPRMLCHSIGQFADWQQRWTRFKAARGDYLALTDDFGVAVYSFRLRDAEIDAQIMKLRLQDMAAMFLQQRNDNGRPEITCTEAMLLAHAIIDAGWHDDMNLAGVLNYRAELEQQRDPRAAEQFREFADRIRGTSKP
ncbi:MAG: hypothetical protein IT462_11490 [Planctomycetes bacterium]|nr:hypothetical protein [Planctomycetota bacterium]